ncbi:MAG TPA: hypothetical protein VN670_07185 [Acidobacteriaceae bacterium]|nr:hypothetical protein [Acidobacteriaceae bacterium]
MYIEAKISTPFFFKKNGTSMMIAIYSNRKTALGTASGSGEVQFHLIDITPAPIFSWLKRTHNGMVGFVEVFGRVPVF